jgi:sigma-E factor negative regulatory protein RseA
MSDPVKEQLSAFLDGELSEGELDLLLKQVQRDPELQHSLGRYAMAGEALRASTFPVPSAGFAAKISQAIAAEAGDPKSLALPAGRALAAPRWLRPAGGAAIAAGVAVLAVMALQPQSPETAPVTMASVDATPSDKYIVPSTATTANQLVPAAYLAKYVMAHSEYALPLGRRTVLSSVLSDDESELVEASAVDDESIPTDSLKTQP